MIKFLAEHQGLLYDRQVDSLTFFGFEVLKALLLEKTLSELVLAIHLLLLSISVVSDLHDLLSTLSLAFDTIQDPGLIPLQNAEACLQRLKHPRVLVLDLLGKNERVESLIVFDPLELRIAIVRSCRAHAIIRLGVHIVLTSVSSGTLIKLSELMGRICRVRCLILLIKDDFFLSSIIVVLPTFLSAKLGVLHSPDHWRSNFRSNGIGRLTLEICLSFNLQIDNHSLLPLLFLRIDLLALIRSGSNML